MDMKFKFRDRLLLMICAVVGLFGALLVGTLTGYALWYKVPPTIRVMDFQIGALFGTWNLIIWGLVAVLLLLVSIWMLRLAFRHESKHDKGSVSVQNTEHGDVRISVQAIDMLVKRAIGNTEGVVDVKTRVINHEDSITVMVDMTLDSDVHIPNTTVLMQRSIKNFIEEYSGIAVRDVTILVSKIIEVTPHPPLQIEAKASPAPQVIDVPDAIEPDPAPIAPAAHDEIVVDPVVSEYEADHTPAVDTETPVASEPEASEEDGEEPEGEVKADTVSEKDLW